MTKWFDPQNTWVNIYFDAEIPIVFTGQITNLEEDQIEITSIDKSQKPIYIDFGYKGIPKDIPFKIEIREMPSGLTETSSDETDPSAPILDKNIDDTKIDEASLDEIEDEINDKIVSSITDIEDEIKDKILRQISFSLVKI